MPPTRGAAASGGGRPGYGLSARAAGRRTVRAADQKCSGTCAAAMLSPYAASGSLASLSILSFKRQLGTVTKASTTYQSMVLTLGWEAFSGAQAVQTFIGVGGELRDVNGNDNQVTGTFADDVLVTDGGIGFFASLNHLSLVSLKNNNATPTVATDDKSYMALELNQLTAKLVGIEGLTFGVYDAAVRIHR